MSKQIIAKDKNGKKCWIVVPNICVYSFATNPKKVTYLEIFYFFAQKLIKIPKKLKEEDEKKITESKKRIMIELDNRIQQLVFFANETKKQGEKIMRKKHHQKICSYQYYQIFLSYLTAYLDSLHSMQEEILKIDKFINKKNYSEKIWQEEWFKVDIDIRTLLHHIESPILWIEDKKFVFKFERLDLMEKNKSKLLTELLIDPKQNYAEFCLDPQDIDKDIIKHLNIWAEKYLQLIDKNATIDAITGHYKDGRVKNKKVTLGELMKIA